MNGLCGLIEVKLHVVDKAEEGGGELGVDVIPLDPDDFRPLHDPYDFEELFPGFFKGPSKRRGFDAVHPVPGLCGNAVWRIGAGGELSIPDAEVARPAAGTSEKKKAEGEKEKNRFHLWKHYSKIWEEEKIFREARDRPGQGDFKGRPRRNLKKASFSVTLDLPWNRSFPGSRGGCL